MTVIPDPLGFEWDKGNVDKNLNKHGITMDEAESVFVQADAILISDEKHSLKENRYVIIGKSNTFKYLFISFTLRNNQVRTISARRMHRKEVEKYEKIQKNI